MTRTHTNADGGSGSGQGQGQRSRGQPRQVIPDVTKSAEIMGISIMALLKAYLPTTFVLFYAINMATWTLPLVVIGLVMAVVTTVAVFAAPSHDEPLQYIWLVVNHKTGQGVLRHE